MPMDTPLLPALFDAGLGKTLGFRLLLATAENVQLSWDVDERHLQPWGLVNGGVYAAAVETACSLGASLAAGPERKVAGMENHTSFLRPVGGGALTCHAAPIHCGRSTQLWEARIVDADERLVATGRLRLAVLS